MKTSTKGVILCVCMSVCFWLFWAGEGQRHLMAKILDLRLWNKQDPTRLKPCNILVTRKIFIVISNIMPTVLPVLLNLWRVGTLRLFHFLFLYVCYFCFILIFLSSDTLLAAKGFSLGAYALRSDPRLTALKQKKSQSPGTRKSTKLGLWKS